MKMMATKILFYVFFILQGMWNIYLLSLALSDSVYLISVFLSNILTSIRCSFFPSLPLDIFHRSQVWCSLLQYLMDLSADYSSCLILAFTIERFLACYHSELNRKFCSLKYSKYVSLTLVFICAVFIGPYHFLYMEHYVDYNVCAISMKNEVEFSIWYIVEASVFRIIPVAIIAILNVFVAIKLKEMVTENHRLQTGYFSNVDHVSRANKNIQLTLMLVLVSTTYVLVYLPILLQFIISKLHRSNIIEIDYESLSESKNYTKMLYISGFATNFLIYTFSANSFRRRVRGVFKRNTNFEENTNSLLAPTLVVDTEV